MEHRIVQSNRLCDQLRLTTTDYDSKKREKRERGKINQPKSNTTLKQRYGAYRGK